MGAVVHTATAADAPTPANLLAAKATPEAKRMAKSAPQAVALAATVCGDGYALQNAKPLGDPDPNKRIATIFNYTKGGNRGGCTIYDNNLGTKKYMSLTVCDMNKKCASDKGVFLQYAGPVYTSAPVCATVDAFMKDSSSASVKYATYHSDYAYLCD
ncbi:hypothetical protein ACQB60_40605 [Actinomycetota bacterium Odt1-20B]